MTKALAYLRVSGKAQVEGDGFPRQREAIARYAKTAGVEVVEEFRDEGVSGTKDLDGREGLGDSWLAFGPTASGSYSSSAPIGSPAT